MKRIGVMRIGWKVRVTLLVGMALICGSSTDSMGATYTMTADDVSPQTSFNAGTHWSSGAAPSAGNDYVDAAYLLRSPENSTSNFTFGGDTLTLGNGTTSGTLAYKGSGSHTLTINSLTLNVGTLANYVNATTVTYAGAIIVGSGGGTIDCNGSGRSITISASLSGSGSLLAKLGTATSGSGTVSLTGNNSAYSGNITIQKLIVLDAQVDKALGSGNITLQSGATLKLDSGSTNDYIGDNAVLVLASSSTTVNLAFTGTDNIGQLSFDGGLTFVAAGIWGAVGSGAQYTSSHLTGTGFLVVPEPSSAFIIGTGGLAVLLKRRKREGKVHLAV